MVLLPWSNKIICTGEWSGEGQTAPTLSLFKRSPRGNNLDCIHHSPGVLLRLNYLSSIFMDQ